MAKKATARRVEPEIVGARDLAPYRNQRTAIVAYQERRTEIEAAHTIAEVKPIRDMMVTLGFHARIAKDKKAEFMVSEIRIRAERKSGQILAEMEKSGQRAGRGHTKQKNRISSANDIRRTLREDLGISPDQSSYWQKVAAIPETRFEAAIARSMASAHRVSAIPPHTAIRMEVKGISRNGRGKQIADDKGIGRGPFAVVYADPPWQYSESERKMFGGIGNDYPPMELPDIKSCLEDREIELADEAVLFLWATIPLLPQALEVMKEWGFEYRHAVAWDKRAGCVGEYFDGRWEVLLVGHKGKFPPPSISNFPNFFSISRTGDSRKPEEFRRLIEWIHPAFDFDTRVELFGRPPTAPARGWTAMVEGAFKNHPDDIADAVNDFLANGSLYGPKAALIVEALDEPDKYLPPEVLAAMGK